MLEFIGHDVAMPGFLRRNPGFIHLLRLSFDIIENLPNRGLVRIVLEQYRDQI